MPADVMLAKPLKKQRLPATVLLEPKLDGVRCYVKQGHCYSRTSKHLTNFNHLAQALAVVSRETVFDGELMPSTAGGAETFRTVMRQLYRHGANTSGIGIALFDAIPLAHWRRKSSPLTQTERRNSLERLVPKKLRPHIWVVPAILAPSDPKVIQSVYQSFLAAGYEGIMVKDPHAPYEWARRGHWLKMKPTHTMDLPIVGFQAGEGKHVGRLGALLVERDGIVTEVGTGFSDVERTTIWRSRQHLLGVQVEVAYQEISSHGRLRFPVFKRLRTDKRKVRV